MQARRIMIVEDESIVRLHLCRIVENMGHEVVGLAASADEARSQAEAASPELVLMDINLNGERDGVDAARELVETHGCAIVFATAFADDKTIARTEAVGAIGYVLKPFGEPAVRAAVATALHEHDRMVSARARERSLAGIIGGLGEAVMLVDERLNIQFANLKAEMLAATTAQSVVGQPVLNVLQPSDDDRPILEQALTEACRQGTPSILPTVLVKVPSGGEVLMSGSVEPMANGGQSGFVITMREVTRRQGVMSAQGNSGGDTPRMMIYSHDTFGLGHLRRSLNLAAALVDAVPNLSILLVTGSAVAHRFALPTGVDYVKLPSVRKVSAEHYSPRSLTMPDDEVLALRTNLLLRTARDFRPDVLLVDHSPAGMRGELEPALAWLRDQHPACQTIIGLRDIIDDPDTVTETWHKQGIYNLLENCYDQVVIYGSRKFFDPVKAYRMPPRVAERVHFVGHVVEDVSLPEAPARIDRIPHIVVTTGGGDGAVEEVAGGFLAMLGQGLLAGEVTATVLPGPLAPAETVAALQATAVGTSATVESFAPSTSPHMAAADLVICTGGYNTAVQALRYAKRALMIPRVMHRKEQLLRATSLSELGLVQCLRPDELSAERLAATINAMLADPAEPLTEARQRGVFDLEGSANLAKFCRKLLTARETTAEATHD